jgi:hypothetical protein
MMSDEDLDIEDYDMLHELCGKENRVDTNKIRKKMLEYLWDNHREIVIEAYKNLS